MVSAGEDEGPAIQPVDSLSTPALVGICLGGLLLLTTALAVSCLCVRGKRVRNKKLRVSEGRPLPVRRPTAVRPPQSSGGPPYYLKKSPSPTGAKTPPGAAVKTPSPQQGHTPNQLTPTYEAPVGDNSSSPTPTPGNRRTPLGIRSPSSSASPYHAEDFRSESSIRFALECEKKKSPTDLTVVKEHALADFSGMGTGSSNTNNPTQADTKDSKGSGEGANKLGRLFFKVRHNGEKNTLMVTVVKCVGLPVRDSGAGTSDPYVKLQLLPDKQHKVKTRVLRRTLNPVYDEDFTFYGIAVNQLASLTLHFAVLSFDRYSRDDVIGEVMLPVTAALEETEQITNGNGEQSPATPTSTNPATSPAILSRDIAPRSLKMRSQGRGELLVSLCYQPQASRLTAVILKARNIPRMDITGLADPYVKIYLLHNGQRIAKKKTHVKKRTLNPVFNESFVFDVPAAAEGLENLSLEFLVLDWDRVTKNEVIGRLELGGPKATGSALHHWNEVLYSPRRQIAEWHKLRE